jgi:hypothetical protein
MAPGSAVEGLASAPPRGRLAAATPSRAPARPPAVPGRVLPAPPAQVSYLEDPQQLAIYRWRSLATTAVLLVLVFVLSWAAGELLRSAVDVLRPVGEAIRLTG